MAKKKDTPAVEEVHVITDAAPAASEGQQISVEQILAAVLAKFGPVLIQPDLLSMDFSKYSVQVDQDQKTGFVMFGLIDNEAVQNALAETSKNAGEEESTVVSE